MLNSEMCTRQKKTVLIVEDNPQAAKLLSLYLTEAGYRTVVADCGSMALDLAGKHCPAAITLDLLLPDMDGWEVLSELKAAPRTRDIPVVIVSVLDRQSLGFHLGAADYLVKPVARVELLKALRRFAPGDEGACRKIMVVHSDLDELNMLAMVVAQEHYEVILASGIDEAAWLAKNAHPDLVVTDLLAGGIDCFALLEGLKAERESAHVPVLALTSSDFNQAEAMGENGRIEFVLLGENELVEERLLGAITLLFKRKNQADEHKDEGT